MAKINIRQINIWRAGKWFFLLLSLSFAGVGIFSGYVETEDAFESGRRIVIVRESGEIQGKKIYTNPHLEKDKPEEPLPEKSPEETKPENTPEETHTDKTPDVTEKKPEDHKTETKKIEPDVPVDLPDKTHNETQEKIIPGEEIPAISQIEDYLLIDESVTLVPSQNPLAKINDKITEKTPLGKLPVIGTDGTKACNYYAKPFHRSGNEPIIAIIITGLGHSRYVTEKSMTLSENFSLSFSPYAKNIARWAETARYTAHEKLIDMPMEPNNYPAADPGPYGMILDKGLQENANRLRWVLSRFGGYIGIVAPYDEVYTKDSEALKVLLQLLANRGLMIVMEQEPLKSDNKIILEESNTPNIIVDMRVDDDMLASSIDTRLSSLERLAKKRGYAVGVVRGNPMVLERLEKWTEKLDERGVRLAPVSAVVRIWFP